MGSTSAFVFNAAQSAETRVSSSLRNDNRMISSCGYTIFDGITFGARARSTDGCADRSRSTAIIAHPFVICKQMFHLIG